MKSRRFTALFLPCFPRESRARATAALRDFNLAYVCCGSFTSDAVEATRACLSAVARKRTNGPASWDVRFVPEADIDASLLRRLEPFQMVQLVCRGTFG
jgi:hypothetical protein